MKKQNFVEVAIALPVNNTYIYKVPEYLEKNLKSGMRALVPFGRRRVTGYIIAGKDHSNGYQAKLLFDLLDDEPIFPVSMIAFFKWISNYYLHPLGQVIKTALPVGLNTYDVATLYATNKGLKSRKDDILTPGESNIIELIDQKGSIPVKTITKDKTISGNSLIKKMAQKDLIKVVSKLRKDQTKIKKEKFILYQSYPKDNIKLSQKRLQILDIVKKNKEISLTNLKKQVPTALRLVNFLAESKYLQIIEKQVFRDPFGDPVDPDIPPELTKEQEKVVSKVKQNINKGFQRYLLSGVTGSGKTEVYMRIVSQVVNKGRQAIVLVPEISLISQTERRFRARFGSKIAVIHSGLSKGELLDQWNNIAKQKVSIVIGARSAIFAPLDNLGLIIVDEEHDTSYKQESSLRYNARDLAVVRASLNNFCVVLGSATPSIQSCYNVNQGKFKELELKTRINKRSLPKITLIDLKKYKDYRGLEKLITPELIKEISKCLARGNQALIFLNRRGFANFPVCGSCGEAIKCKFCEVTMTFHKNSNEFKCHLCGFTLSSEISCPHCNSSKIKPLGFGTEKIENILKKMFPHARVARLDQDTTSKKGETVRILKKVKNHLIDIIVGTQMLAKGHDFPGITLVGIICADLSLNFPDFRAGERTFQLLAQVAGRAGRGDKTGKVIMQTYNPKHFSIEASKNQDFVQFYNQEIPFRKALSYPPFTRIIQLRISGKNKKQVEEHSFFVEQICQSFSKQATKDKKNMTQILGPIEAGIPKISMRYRWQILLKSNSANTLNDIVKNMIKDKKTFNHKNVKVEIDVDPYFMM